MLNERKDEYACKLITIGILVTIESKQCSNILLPSPSMQWHYQTLQFKILPLIPIPHFSTSLYCSHTFTSSLLNDWMIFCCWILQLVFPTGDVKHSSCYTRIDHIQLLLHSVFFLFLSLSLSLRHTHHNTEINTKNYVYS